MAEEEDHMHCLTG